MTAAQKEPFLTDDPTSHRVRLWRGGSASNAGGCLRAWVRGRPCLRSESSSLWTQTWPAIEFFWRGGGWRLCSCSPSLLMRRTVWLYHAVVPRARFLRASASSAEDDDSSIVSLQARFSDLLRCVLCLLFCVDRCARVCENRCIRACSARRRTAALRAALLVVISTQQLLFESMHILRDAADTVQQLQYDDRAVSSRLPVEEWNSVEVTSCRGSSHGCVGNRSGFGEEDDSNTGEVGERELVLVFVVL